MSFIKGKAFGKCICCHKFTPVLFRNAIADEDEYICNDCLEAHVDGSAQDLANWASAKNKDEIINLFKNSRQKIDARSDQTKQQQQVEDQYQSIKNKITEDDSEKVGRYYFDSKGKQILKDRTLFDDDYKLYSFNDIVNYQPIQNGHNEHKHHGITRAVVGGAIAGGAGAIIGALTGGKDFDYIDKLGVSIAFKDGSSIQLIFLESQQDANGLVAKMAYKHFYDVCGALDSALAENKQENHERTDTADEIAKFKKLLDDGTITQDEFDAKKKQLLGL